MARKQTCRHCGQQHFNFAPCQTKLNKRLGMEEWKRNPHLHEGQRVWGQGPLETVERRGDTVIVPGLRLPAHGGRVIEPKREEGQ